METGQSKGYVRDTALAREVFLLRAMAECVLEARHVLLCCVRGAGNLSLLLLTKGSSKA